MHSQFSSPYSHNPCKCIWGAQYYKIFNTLEETWKTKLKAVSVDIWEKKRKYAENIRNPTKKSAKTILLKSLVKMFFFPNLCFVTIIKKTILRMVVVHKRWGLHRRYPYFIIYYTAKKKDSKAAKITTGRRHAKSAGLHSKQAFNILPSSHTGLYVKQGVKLFPRRGVLHIDLAVWTLEEKIKEINIIYRPLELYSHREWDVNKEKSWRNMLIKKKDKDKVVSNLNHTGDDLNALRCRTGLKKPSESKQRRSDHSIIF